MLYQYLNDAHLKGFDKYKVALHARAHTEACEIGVT